MFVCTCTMGGGHLTSNPQPREYMRVWAAAPFSFCRVLHEFGLYLSEKTSECQYPFLFIYVFVGDFYVLVCVIYTLSF